VLIIAFMNSGLSHANALMSRQNKIAASMLHSAAPVLQLLSAIGIGIFRGERYIARSHSRRASVSPLQPAAHGVGCSNIITITVHACATCVRRTQPRQYLRSRD
jgi:hypothetical protein